MSKRWLIRIGVLLALVGAVVLLRAFVLRPRTITVDATPVERGRVEETVTNSRAGTVMAHLRTRLSPEIGGIAVRIPYREGEAVPKGAVLLELDDRLQRAQLELRSRELEAVEAQRRQACLNAEHAAREYVRVERLAEGKIVADDVLDSARNRRDTAQAACAAAASQVAQAGSALELARVELDKMTLRAPFDGVIADLSIEVGEWTSPSPPALPIPPVVDLLDPSSIYVSAPMDEVDAARLGRGQEVRVTVDSHRGQTFAGRVRRVADYVLDLEAQNRTVEIEVDIDDREVAAALRAGTSADVEVILAVREDTLRVPAMALFEGNRVLLVEDGRLVERQVEVGLRNWNYAEVRSGLQPGDVLVVSLDRSEVRAGARVEVSGKKPAAAVAAGSGS